MPEIRRQTVTSVDEIVRAHGYGPEEDKALQHYLAWVAKGTFYRDKKSKLPMISQGILESVTGLRAKSTNFCDLLKKGEQYHVYFYQYVNGFFQGQSNRSRLLAEDSNKRFVETVLYQNPRNKKRWIIETEEEATEKHIKKIIRKIKAETKGCVWRFPVQMKMAQYLNDLNENFFFELLEKNYDTAFRIAKAEKNEKGMRFLHQFCDNPFEFYVPRYNKKGELSASPRLFGSTLAFMPSSLRKELMRGCLDFDLTHCQISIIGFMAKNTCINDYLKTHINFWNDFLKEIKLPEKYKDIIKEMVYSLCYGKNRWKARKDLREKLPKFYTVQRFFDHPLIKELLASIEQLEQQARKDGGLQGAYDFMQPDKEQRFTSFLSCVVQSYEMALVEPCYDIAIKRKNQGNVDFAILLHQHDGITVKVFDGVSEETVIKRLKRAVQKVADSFGIVTSFEVKPNERMELEEEKEQDYNESYYEYEEEDSSYLEEDSDEKNEDNTLILTSSMICHIENPVRQTERTDEGQNDGFSFPYILAGENAVGKKIPGRKTIGGMKTPESQYQAEEIVNWTQMMDGTPYYCEGKVLSKQYDWQKKTWMYVVSMFDPYNDKVVLAEYDLFDD